MKELSLPDSYARVVESLEEECALYGPVDQVREPLENR
jgi:hypothetical protein